MKTLSQRIISKNETNARRAQLTPIVYELKVHKHKASKKNSKSKETSSSNHAIQNQLTQFSKLQKFFQLSKYFKNDIICSDNINKYNTKIDSILVKWYEKQELKSKSVSILDLPAQIKQAIHAQIIVDLQNLSKAKSKGRKVGKLKFCKELNCLTLKQFSVSWDFSENNKIRITGIGEVKVHGLNQIDFDLIKEWGQAKLIKKPSGIYIHILGYKDKQISDTSDICLKDCIGLDFGIKDSIILSNGQKHNLKIQIPKSLKKAQRKLQKSQTTNQENKKIHSIKCGKNQFKLKCKLQKEWQKYTNKKKDLSNKFVNYLKSNYKLIVMQDENLKGWHSGLFGKQVQIDCLGRVKTKIMNLDSSIVISKFEPSTQLCPHCGNKHKLSLAERTYVCKSCGFQEDRDTKSAKTILCLGLSSKYLELEENKIHAERMKLTPQDKIASFKTINISDIYCQISKLRNSHFQ